MRGGAPGRYPRGMAPSDTISFARGAPSLDIVDVVGLREAAVAAFTNDPGGVTGYGTSIGYPPLRRWIAEQHGVKEAQVLVTNGSMQADAFLFQTLVSAGDAVVVEKPTYDRTLLNLRTLGADVRMVSLRTDGIDVDELCELLDSGLAPKLIHIIPNFQNPAGYTLSLDKRKALLKLAAEHDTVIFEDDPYRHIRFAGEDIPTMLELDEGENVVYASSFSKTVCPGIRVGYLVGPEALIAQIQKLATNTYISPSMVSQSIVYEFCVSGGLERSIAKVRRELSKRVVELIAQLAEQIPDAVYTPPQGGYFMWVELPESVDVDALFVAAGEHGVTFVKGSDFLLEGGRNTLRLAFSGVTLNQIDEGIQRLADAYISVVGPPGAA